ncbi:MAG: hypothetical protein HY914_14480 [Desulfomonile tiedjei]|nr:hypothetical protein [Desulfomonile tiedjei]
MSPTEDAALDYAIQCQRNRRNLTDDQILSCIQTLGDRRKGGQHTGNQHSEHGTVPLGTVPKLPPTVEENAEQLGVSERKVKRANTVIDNANEATKEAVKAGEMSINKAYEETRGWMRNADPRLLKAIRKDLVPREEAVEFAQRPIDEQKAVIDEARVSKPQVWR